MKLGTMELNKSQRNAVLGYKNARRQFRMAKMYGDNEDALIGFYAAADTAAGICELVGISRFELVNNIRI